MATLGKCLIFYLKYPAEMERLYEYDDEEPNVEGLPDPDRTLEKVRQVGDVASREGAEFLETCAGGIEGHLRAISSVQRVRNSLEDTWDLRFRVTPNKAKGRPFEVGVNLSSRRVALVPWVWCPGGRRVEDEVVRILGRGIKSAKLDFSYGSVGLAEIRIPVPERLEEPVSADSLIAEVQRAFTPFTAEDIKAIAAIIGTHE